LARKPVPVQDISPNLLRNTALERGDRFVVEEKILTRTEIALIVVVRIW
jgi:hypothetical protein